MNRDATSGAAAVSALADGRIEHRGIVQRIDGERAVVAMATSGCRGCGQGASCGIGRIAAGRAAALLTLPATAGLRAGDEVRVVLPASRVAASALLGYFLPALAMVLGAWAGAAFDGGDGAAAAGAIGGFLGALTLCRLLVGLLPGLAPAPRIVPLPRSLSTPSQEYSHER